ncbi:MAG: DUF1801 domain-containing protein [Anaerolineales bacterium]|nr:DUF1801 domain-containing protein [Anaerolineales bacterium]
MKANSNPDAQSAAQQIDAIIENTPDWRGQKLAHLRAVIKQADPEVVEEVKWKKPSKPEGVPVWSHAGILCVADTLKKAVRLTFPKGAQMADPQHLFNTRLDSNTVRAVDFFETGTVDDAALKALILEAIGLTRTRSQKQNELVIRISLLVSRSRRQDA